MSRTFISNIRIHIEASEECLQCSASAAVDDRRFEFSPTLPIRIEGGRLNSLDLVATRHQILADIERLIHLHILTNKTP